MDSQKKPINPWIKAFIMALIFLITLSCMIGELLTMELSDLRTATANAQATEWRQTYTAEAKLYNYKTATSWQATENSKIATHKADMATYDADLRSLTQTAQAPKPPVITGINFPSEIPGNKSTMIGLLYFTDPDGDIQYVKYDVIRATKFGGGADNAPKLNSGNWNNGAIKVYIWCDGQQNVTLEATIHDRAGNKSNPWRFSFTCK